MGFLERSVKMTNEIIEEKEVVSLYNGIKEMVEQSRNRVYKTINTEMINLYWNIGKMIVEKQGGNERARYGDYLIKEVSIKLTNIFGKGFSITNLKNMRKLYLYYPKRTTMLSQLTWSHYLELIKIKESDASKYYS